MTGPGHQPTTRETDSLADALGLGDTGITSVVGAGGKTTTVFRLATELAARGRTVVVTTTTKFGTDQLTGPMVEVAGAVNGAERVRATLQTDGPVVVAVDHREGTKAFGVPPAMIDRLRVGGMGGYPPPDHVLVEADGARRRSLKAPADYEPVVSRQTDLVVAVMGLSALGGTVAEVCHRPEQVSALTGRGPAETVRPADVAAIARSARGAGQGVPTGSRLAVVLSQVGAEHATAASEITAAILEAGGSGPPVERVVVVPRYRPGNDPEPTVRVAVS